jgi:hypothetical protein
VSDQIDGLSDESASRAGTRRKSKKSAKRDTVPLDPVPQATPPIELAKFFTDPPLAGMENREDFYRFFSAIAAAIKPPDAIAWLLTWDVVCLSWEIKRERAVKADIIKSAQLRAAARFLGLIEDIGEKFGDLEEGYESLGQNFKEIRRFTSEDFAKLVDNGYTPSDILAEAYIVGAADINAIDRRIASYETRRMAVMREVEHYNEKYARKLDTASGDIAEAEFTDLPPEVA